jgi:beta-galactosidase
MKQPRGKILFEDGWMFVQEKITVPYAVKAGMTGGITDTGCPEDIDDGDWLKIAYTDRGMDSRELAWKPVQLPHDWCVEQQYVASDDIGARPGSHGYLPSGTGFYRKLFTVPAQGLGKKWSIRFDGITGSSTVWVNGHLLIEHRGGYLGFACDLTDVLRYGDEGENVITVKVDTTDHEGWWYEGCGIYRHVWLEYTERLHIAEHGIQVATPEITPDYALVTVKTEVSNEHTTDANIRLHTAVYDQDKRLVASSSLVALAPWYAGTQLEQQLTVEHPRLWSPEQPDLYSVLVTIWHGEAIADSCQVMFGIRSISFDAEQGFILNGIPTPIKGTCNHQDFAGVGVALPDSLIDYKLRLLKEMGSNAYRSAHHPAAPELLDLCDRLGMLVIDENRKLDSSSTGLSQLKELIRRDGNHPSVIMWCMENEEVLEGTVTGARILKTMADTAHRIDPARQVVAAMNHGWNEGGYSDVIDIVGYNYGQRDAQDIRDREDHPGRLVIGTESASFTTTRGEYADDPERGYCSAYGTNLPSWSCSPEKAWNDVMQHPFLTGVFLWTGFDYRGEPTPYLWPCINSHFGIMDTCGFPKDIYYYIKAAWTGEPVLHLFPHWNWQGREGELIDVRAYTNLDAVELFVNGVSLGVQQTEGPGELQWPVVYVPGELRAVGRRNGLVCAETTVFTTETPCRIELYPHRTAINADGADTVAVRVAVTDQHGRVVPYADNDILFSVTGPGRILGVGNGNPSSHEPDKANRRRTFHGWCLVLVQSSGGQGILRLQAASPGLAGAEAVLQLK